MPGFISIREGGYGPWEAAVDNVADAGILALEVGARPLEDLERIAAAAAEKGVRIATLSGGVNLDKDDSIADFEGHLASAGKLGVPVFFVSVSGSELHRPEHIKRLRALAEVAAQHGVVLSMETHPPFCQNAEGMLLTVSEVDHPNCRVNLDTANIFYYNEGLDSADELQKVIGVTASLHLKDTDGGYHSENFPVLGEGIVKFERIRYILVEAGFDGPLTIELEGPVVAGLDVPERHAKVCACMDFLRSINLA